MTKADQRKAWKGPKSNRRPNQNFPDRGELNPTNLVANDQIWQQFLQEQNGFQSGLETAPLAAVIAGYYHFLGQFQARSST